MEDCAETMGGPEIGIFESTLHSFEQFRGLCLQLDPGSLVMALYGAVCEICGDGDNRRG
jgi:hypothetical protein